MDYPVWKALKKLQKKWGTRSHSATIAKSLILNSARRQELRCNCDNGVNLKKLMDLAAEHGPDILELLMSLIQRAKE